MINSPPPVAPKLRILIIDDEQDIRTLLKLILGPRHEVAEAENGMVGLTMLDKFEPDFIICDIMMPVLTGLETVEAIRKHPRFYDTPVFFLSGERHADLKELTMEAGGNLFLQKPIDPVRLVHMIDVFVDEMGITPRQREAPQEPVRPAPAAPHEPPAGPIRILGIDPVAQSLKMIARMLEHDPKGRWETLWSIDPGASLANLYRLQPDLILYNPRQQMPGIAFVQNLAIRKVLDDLDVCFFGSDISDAEAEFNRKHLGREPIWLTQPPEEIVHSLAGAIRDVAPKYKKKRFTLEQLGEQEAKTAAKGQAAREDEARRDKFARLQDRIDRMVT